MSPNVNSVASKFQYNGVEHEEALGLNIYETYARGYDPAIGKFMQIDPLADLHEQIDKTPYAFAWNNPIFFNDPSGLCPDCPDPSEAQLGDTYTLVNGSEYTFNGTEWEKSTVEQLDEVVISNGTVNTGSAQGAHVVETNDSWIFNGFKVLGLSEGNFHRGELAMTGFSYGYDTTGSNNLLGQQHGDIGAHGLKIKLNGHLGNDEDNVGLELNGSLFEANGNGDLELYTDPNGKQGLEIGLGVSASGIKGGFTPSVTIGGVKLGFTIGGSLGSIGAGGRAAATYDNSTNNFEVSNMFHLSFGAGFRVGFSVSNTKQKVYRRK